MGVVLRRLQYLDKADARPDRTCRTPGAFFGAVTQAKFQGIHANLFAQDIDGRFHGIGRGGDTRSAVGCRLRLIHHDIKPFDPGVGNLIGPHDPMTGRGHRGAWERSSLVDQVRFPSHQASVFRRPQLDAHVRARGWSGGFKHLGPGHRHLHRVPGLARQRRGYRFDVDQRLATKSSADLMGIARTLDTGILIRRAV